MNGYTMMKEGYKRLLEQGKVSEKEAGKRIRIYDFLENCDKEDLFALVDSSAFNDIIKGYCEIALEKGNVSNVFEGTNAEQAYQKYVSE